MTQQRGTRVVAVVGVLLFWAGVFGAAALVDGYASSEDYISSLASRGSSVAALGIGAFLASAVAQAATSRTVFTGWRAHWCAVFVLFGGVATASVATFRASCPGGPPGCALGDDPPGDWVDAVHGVSVGLYELCTLAAMLILAGGALRRTSALPRWLGLLSLVAAIGSVLLIGQTNGDNIGLWQRLWLANNLAWLLVVAWAATGHHRDDVRGPL